MPEDKTSNGGAIHISEDVIVELASKTIQGIPNIKTASRSGSKFGLGRKNSSIRASVDHPQGIINIDAYVLVKYGQRIPDIAWDVQEKIKDNLERYTGYSVKAVNVNVQGVYMNSGENVQLDAVLGAKEPDSDEEED